MKIGIDIRSTLKKKTGIGRYTVNLLNALADLDEKNSYYLYSSKKIMDFRRGLLRLPGANFSHRVDYFKRGPSAVLPEVDVFHTSSYDLQRPGKARYIVTVHDVIIKAYPHGHSERTIREIDDKLRRVLGEADLLVADSYNTRSDLLKFYSADEARIKVIYPGVNLKVASRESRVASHEYILFVGTLEPRKNVAGLIRAFDWFRRHSGTRHKLVITGMKGWMFEDIFKAYEASGFKKDIIFKGYVRDDELAGLYQQASIFVYPSFYEGFGFPIIEAFSCGVPVVTSRTSSCGEIAGDAALLIDPYDYKEIGQAILKLVNDNSLKEEIVRKGLERAKEFTWKKTAREFLKLLNTSLP